MDLLQRIKKDRPVVPLLGAPGTKLTKTNLKENLRSFDVQFETLSKIIEEFAVDGIFPFMDLTVEVETLGVKVNFPENDNPSVIEHDYKTEEALIELKSRWKGISGRMEVFVNVIKRLSEEYPSLIKGAYVIGPFSMVGELMGASDAALKVMLEPELVKKYLEFCNEVILEYTNALFDAGADTVAVLEPTAVILSPEQYEEFSQKPFKELVEKVAPRPLILHICGNTEHLIEKMVQSGAAGLSLDYKVDFKKVKEEVPEEIALIGNIDPTGVLLQSTPEVVRQEVLKLRKDMEGSKNFILSSGCDIPLDTPLENIKAFMKAGREKI